MKTSEEITEINKAFAAAQKDFPVIEKNREGQIGHRKFKYAELDKIRAQCDPVLHKHGLFVTHGMELINDKQHLTTRLDHVSGQWKESSFEFDVNEDLKSQGMSITYLSRYGYCSILGIATSEDLDAHQHLKDKEPEKKPPAQKKPKPQTDWGTGRAGDRISQTMWDDLVEEAERHGWTEEVLKKTLKNSFGYTAAKQVKVEDAHKVVDIMSTKEKKNEDYE